MNNENDTRVVDWSISRPKRRRDVLAHELVDEMILYDGDGRTAISLNASARSIWDLCDGSRTAPDIAAELASKLGVMESDLLPDITATLDNFYRMSVIDK